MPALALVAPGPSPLMVVRRYGVGPAPHVLTKSMPAALKMAGRDHKKAPTRGAPYNFSIIRRARLTIAFMSS